MDIGGHSSPFNQVQPTRRLDDAANLARVEAESSILELLLHVALAEVTQVAPLTGAAAVGLGQGELAKGGLTRLDLLLVGLDDVQGVLLAAGDLCLSPAGRTTTAFVLDEQMGSADLALGGGDGLGSGAKAGAVVGSHVVLQLVRVGPCRRLPAGDLFGGIEIVGEVLGVGVSYFPAVGETGVSLENCFCQLSLEWPCLGERGPGPAQLCKTRRLEAPATAEAEILSWRGMFERI